MKKVIHKLSRYLDSSAKRRRAFKATGPLQRLADAEVRHDALAQEVGVKGIFSDWPATVTYDANGRNM